MLTHILRPHFNIHFPTYFYIIRITFHFIWFIFHPFISFMFLFHIIYDPTCLIWFMFLFHFIHIPACFIWSLFLVHICHVPTCFVWFMFLPASYHSCSFFTLFLRCESHATAQQHDGGKISNSWVTESDGTLGRWLACPSQLVPPSAEWRQPALSPRGLQPCLANDPSQV